MNVLNKLSISLVLSICTFLGVYAQDTYQNPVSKKSLPDPTVMRAPDGWFYLYATEDTHNVPIYKSKNLTTWRYAGTAFTDATRPMDFVSNGAIWAPEINYFQVGDKMQYVLYYSKSEWGKTWECGIGVAVSDYPNTGFHDAHKLFISSEMGLENCIDPFFIEDNGKKYLFFGSFHDIYGIELTEDGMAVKEGASKFKIAGGLIEATTIMKHDGWFYLIGSAGSCCEGASSTYRLVMARSRRVTGPYVDRNNRTAIGDNMSLLLQKSDEVVGPGHCSRFVEDDAGQTWIIYHGFQADNIDGGRVTYLDRIIWDEDGWPTVAGMKPSTEAAVPLFGEAAGISGRRADKAVGYSILPIDGSDMLRIDGPDDQSYSWMVCSVNGSLVSKGTAKGTAVAATRGKGMYIIKVSGKAGFLNEKLVML